MKNKSRRELEKYWAEQAARKAKVARKKTASAEKAKPSDAPGGEESGQGKSTD